MSRPTVAEGRELEALECAAGKVAGALEDADLVALRLRQVLRRAPGLRELVLAGQWQVACIADALEETHVLLCGVLDEKRRARQARHFGSDGGHDE